MLHLSREWGGMQIQEELRCNYKDCFLSAQNLYEKWHLLGEGGEERPPKPPGTSAGGLNNDADIHTKQ